jgi:hypothetical protein
MICPYRVWEGLSVFYFYETGPSRTRPVLMTTGTPSAPVVFDAPKLLTYTHSGTTSNSGRSFDGAQFLLEYRGRGDLVGLPKMCIDKATGLPGNCYPSTSTEIADFNIPATGLFTGINGGVSTMDMKFYTKPTEIAEYYPFYATVGGALDTTPCTTASLAFETFIGVDSQWSTMFLLPAWHNVPFPTPATLATDYFLGGKPAAIKDEAIWALAGMDGQCPA